MYWLSDLTECINCGVSANLFIKLPALLSLHDGAVDGFLVIHYLKNKYLRGKVMLCTEGWLRIR